MRSTLFKMGWILLLLLVVVGSMGAAGKWPGGDEGIIQQASEDGATLSVKDGYLLINNTWNKKATSGGYKQRIFSKENAFGWQWSWGSSYSVVSYPEILYGDTPWDSEQLSSPGMPFLAGTKSVTVDFDITMKGTGTYNMALEFWVVSKVPAASQNITHEVMIWNYNSGMQPAGSKVDRVTFNGIPYDVYIRKGHGDASGVSSVKWDYIAFEARKPVLKGPWNISNFITYLIDKGTLNKELYITTMELGNEIVQGTGRTEIRNYSVTVK